MAQKPSTTTGQKSKYEDLTYQVINEKVIRESIKLKKSDKEDEDKKLQQFEIKTDQIEFHEIEHLEFSFKNIYKISNLEGFDKLTDLQLDNNHISKIQNLNHLANLKRLGK